MKVTAFDGTVKYLPTAIINITTPFYSGIVEALVTAAQPVDLILEIYTMLENVQNKIVLTGPMLIKSVNNKLIQ